MTLDSIKDVLIQSAQLAQKKGVFSLDNAVVVKQAIDLVKKEDATEEEITAGINALAQAAELGQAKGAYLLRDAYYIYDAIQSFNSLSKEPKCTEPVETRQEEDKSAE